MSTFKSFEDIKAWQQARVLVNGIYQISSKGTFSRDYALRDQIRKASVSVMSNIAEGFERDGRREFIQFLAIAKGSAGEVRSLLYIARDQDYLSEREFNQLHAKAVEVSSLIAALMRYLRGATNPGTKYRT